MYSSSEISDIADQTDIGNVFVDQNLVNGKDGKITLSVRQISDNGDAQWMNETYACKVK